MNRNLIVALIAFFLIFADLISLIFRLKASKNNVKTERNKAFWIREISIFVSAPLIIVLCIFIDIGFLGNIAVCGCAVMAVEVAVQELVGKKKSPDETQDS